MSETWTDTECDTGPCANCGHRWRCGHWPDGASWCGDCGKACAYEPAVRHGEDAFDHKVRVDGARLSILGMVWPPEPGTIAHPIARREYETNAQFHLAVDCAAELVGDLQAELAATRRVVEAARVVLAAHLAALDALSPPGGREETT